MPAVGVIPIILLFRRLILCLIFLLATAALNLSLNLSAALKARGCRARPIADLGHGNGHVRCFVRCAVLSYILGLPNLTLTLQGAAAVFAQLIVIIYFFSAKFADHIIPSFSVFLL